MAQGDYLIQNQSFPSFRSDLNSTLEAINTSNSGTSRPSSAVAGTVWLDTTNATNPTLKFYDGADDISLAQLDYTANTVNWLDSTVTISPLTTDLDVGGNAIISSSNGNITFTPDGTGKVIIDGLSYPTSDGTTGQFLKTDGSGNLSFDDAGGGTNTPNFLVAKSGNQTLSSGVVTKISLGTEEYDSDNVFGSDKFTVPSGQGGKYNLFGNVQLQSDGTNKLLNAVVYIFKNGLELSSAISRVSELYDANDITRASLNFSFAINLSASDYVEIYASATHSTGGSIFAREEGTYLGGYKIIE